MNEKNEAPELRYGGLMTASDLARLGDIPLDKTAAMLSRHFRFKDATDPRELLKFIRLYFTPDILRNARTNGTPSPYGVPNCGWRTSF